MVNVGCCRCTTMALSVIYVLVSSMFVLWCSLYVLLSHVPQALWILGQASVVKTVLSDPAVPHLTQVLILCTRSWLLFGAAAVYDCPLPEVAACLLKTTIAKLVLERKVRNAGVEGAQCFGGSANCWNERCSVQMCSVIRCSVVGCSVVGCSVVGCSVVGCSVVGCSVVGCSVVGCSVVGCSVVGCSVDRCEAEDFPYASGKVDVLSEYSRINTISSAHPA